MKLIHGLALVALTLSFNVFAAGESIGNLLISKGSVLVSGLAVKQGDSVSEGAQIVTGPGSIAKILFNNKTTMTFGPGTTSTIKSFKTGETALIDLVKGRIRTSMPKDPLSNNDGGPDKSKLIIQTKSAAMGIRGTVTDTIANDVIDATSAVSYEGEVRFVKINEDEKNNTLKIESGLDGPNGQEINPGQFSMVNQAQYNATIPVKMNPAQFDSMKDNNDFDSSAAKPKTETFNNPNPPGLDSKTFANENGALGESLKDVVGKEKLQVLNDELQMKSDKAPPPEGGVDKSTGQVAPPAGGFLDPNTGLYIAPPPGSQFDPNTQTYVPPPNMGQFDSSTGQYVAPAGFTLEPTGEFKRDESAPPAGGSEGPPPPNIGLKVEPINPSAPQIAANETKGDGSSPKSEGPRMERGPSDDEIKGDINKIGEVFNNPVPKAEVKVEPAKTQTASESTTPTSTAVSNTNLNFNITTQSTTNNAR